MNMGWPPGIVVISPGIFARTNRHESVAPFGICHRMPATGKVRVQRRIVLIVAVEIPSCRIGLPDFDKRMGHGPGIFIKDASTHDNAFANWLAGMLSRQIESFYIGNLRPEYRPRDFRKCVRKAYKRLQRSTLNRRSVGRMEIRGLRAR